jgi:hypothetical protein
MKVVLFLARFLKGSCQVFGDFEESLNQIRPGVVNPVLLFTDLLNQIDPNCRKAGILIKMT